MTSIVKISARCADNKEVVVTVIDFVTDAAIETNVLQNGEEGQWLIYDNRQIITHERLKS
jgi:hypothetical protein